MPFKRAEEGDLLTDSDLESHGIVLTTRIVLTTELSMPNYRALLPTQIIFAIIITAMTVVVWYFSVEHAAKSVGTVADALRSDILARADATTNTLLDNVNVSSTALARLLSSPLIPGNYTSFTTLEQQV
jgi:hypothetical protein